MNESDQQAVVGEYIFGGQREKRGASKAIWLIIVLVVVTSFWFVWSAATQVRPLAYRTSCGAQLKGLATACLLYAEANRGVFPPNLDVLLEGGERAYVGNPKQLICPESGLRYIYIPGQTNTDDLRNVLIYEPISYHDNAGGNMAFIDGHAKWYKADMYVEVLRETDARLAARYQNCSSQPAEESRTCVQTPNQSN